LSKELLNELQNAIVNDNESGALEIAEKIVDSPEVEALEALQTSLPRASEIVGEKFETGEFFLPQLVIAGETMVKVSEVLEKGLDEGDRELKYKVLIGTVEGDVHTIGKNIVKIMLKTAGFEVVDIGEDIKADVFVDKAEELGADIVGASCLMTTTLSYQRQVVERFTERGLRDKYKILVGGGPVTQEWADKIGADGFAEDAAEAVTVAKKLISS